MRLTLEMLFLLLCLEYSSTVRLVIEARPDIFGLLHDILTPVCIIYMWIPAARIQMSTTLAIATQGVQLDVFLSSDRREVSARP